MGIMATALFAARSLRLALPFGKPLDVDGAALRWPMFALALVIWTLTLAAFRVYDPHRFVDRFDELQTVIMAIGAAMLAFAGSLYLTYRGLSRLLYLYFLVLDIAGSLLARVVLRRRLIDLRGGRRRGVLILGAGHTGREIARSLKPAAWMGLTVLGFMDDAAEKIGQSLDGYPVLGTLDRASELAQRGDVHEVVIALPRDAHVRLSNLVAELQALPVNIKVAPDYSDIALYRTSLEDLGGVFLIGLKEPVIGPIDRMIKRLFDLAVASAALVLLGPLMGALAIAIKLTSPGPVLYASPRVGEGGRPFKMLKFRTMYRDADKREQELVQETADGKLVFAKCKDDPRITPLGRFLRRYSLDELPQLWNILIGEMSLVGPRPELPSLVALYEPWQRRRFGVPQGLTGWWQISGRSAKAKYLHVEDDLYYIRNYSLLLDLHILWRTLGAVLRGEGAF
jgi:exopolysaccharide biosynthesis polyprenyl glycosylphosphotransferase